MPRCTYIIYHILCYAGYMREYLGNKLLAGTFQAGSLHFPFQTADSPQLLGMKASLFCCRDLQQNAGVLPWVSRRRMWSYVIGSQFAELVFPFPTTRQSNLAITVQCSQAILSQRIPASWEVLEASFVWPSKSNYPVILREVVSDDVFTTYQMRNCSEPQNRQNHRVEMMFSQFWCLQKKVWMFRAFFCEKRITFPIYKVSRLGSLGEDSEVCFGRCWVVYLMSSLIMRQTFLTLM